MPQLILSLLGNFSAAVDDAPVTGFTYDKVRALLAYLAVEADRPHSRERLADLLWAGYPERSARQSLSNALSVLRRAIDDRAAEPPFLLVSHRELQFNRDCDYALDVAVFTEHCRAIQALENTGPDGARLIATHLDQAAALYRGDFLEGLIIEDSIPFEEWALMQRENLRRQALEVLARLTEQALIREDPEAALQLASRQLALDAWRESAHRQMMCALILDGRRNAAIAHYEDLRRTLATDLGVEPEATTMALASMLKSESFPSTEDDRRGRSPAGSVDHGPLTTSRIQPGERYLQDPAFIRMLAAAMGVGNGPTALPDGRTGGWLTQAGAELPPAPGEPPFMGLQHFDVGDADRFFGREALTTQVLRRLTTASFLAIVGASGSGKSSLVRAGIVAAVQRGTRPPDNEGCAVHLITPTAHPLEALALSLTRDSESVGAATLADDLARDPRSLHLYLSRDAASSATTLIVVDQFEELFTLCKHVPERTAFIENLITAAQESESAKTHVIIALRADFYDHCAAYPNLRDALSRHQVYIGPMTPDSLRHAIEEPASRGNWVFEPGLVELLLHDVGANGMQPPEPGALPLLSHALLETWKRRRGKALTVTSYTEAGGVHGAIAKTADAVYARLTATQRSLARNLFLRLTELGEDTQATRRRITRDEILSDPRTTTAVSDLLNILAEARLITVEQDSVEVAHEALIREWPALQGWLEEDREGLRIHRHLTESALEWERLARDPGELYRGARLAQAIEWANDHAEVMNPLEKAYLSTSQAEAERIEREREDHRQAELRAAQRLADTEQRRAQERERMVRWIGAAAILLFLAVIVAGILANRARLTAQQNAALADDNAAIAATAVAASENEASQRRAAETAQAAEVAARVEADEQRTAAETAREQETAQRAEAEIARTEAVSQSLMARVNVLTLLSDKFSADQYDTALLLSAQAYDMLDSALTRSSLLTALQFSPSFAGFLHTDVGSSERLAFSPDGRTLAIGGDDLTIQLWDLRTRQPVGDLLTGPHSMVGALAFSPQGDHLASGGCGRFDANGNCTEGEILVFDLTTGDMQVYPPVHDAFVLQLAFDPTGTYLISSDTHSVVLWDTAAAQIVHTFVDADEAQFLPGFTLRPDGAVLAVGVCDVAGERNYEYCVQSDVILWDMASRQVLKRIVGPSNPVAGWAFSSDGSLLAAAGCKKISLTPETNACEQGYAQVWDATSGLPVTAPLTGHTDWVNWPAFVRDDTVLITASHDKTIRLWDVASGEALVPPITDLSGDIDWAAVSPDESLLATVNIQEPTIRLWDVEKLGQADPLRTADVLARAPSYLLSLAVDPEETTIAGGTLSGEIYLWDLRSGERTGEPLVGHTDWVYSVAFSPNGTTLASGSADTTIRLWDVRSGQSLMPALEGHEAAVKSVAFSPDGTLLASGSDDTTMRLWDARTGDLLSVNPGMSMVPTSGLGLWHVAFSPDGSLLAGAVAMPEKVAIVWDVSDPTQPRVVARLPTDAVGGATHVEFSPDGTILAVGTGMEGTVLLWDARTYERIGAPIPAHKRTIWPLAFSPDGTLLASGGLDKAIRLIDVATGQLIGPPLITDSLAPMGQSVGMVHSLAFVDGGDALISSNGGGFIHHWDVSPASWKAQACLLAGRNLTQAEWARYLPDTPYQKTCEQWPAED